ncbi:MAG TPA: class I SAM-dependent methyltransferase [Herpetosiphon sp.]|uniref:Methyltransferase type 11 n=1 Tax=Herpetosiphon aurantiacus (strain ATCC 23779 / DSM 785 / 114-95) TaxID=316274 RepID=A9AWZ9_HERA2|nr:class I SAM-dependent methyltransferase [Herpetosiphon sp.]ABX04807.1 Methyltransferase type 11 [Herpetosiphon aurantiacus DSM 785]HBW52483.1 class I SAM-dependent methyltransferase [Herpetosiphon sp.]
MTIIPVLAHWNSDALLAMPFDQYQRYRVSAEAICLLKEAAGASDQPWRILDVGGFFPPRNGVMPLQAFFSNDQTLVVDTAEYVGAGYQQADGTQLPFDDQAFDIVLSCDTLEHIPLEGRDSFLAELRRVARRAVFLAAPHALTNVATSEAMLRQYLTQLQMNNPMLDEHVHYGLPQSSLVEAWLASEKLDYLAFESGYLPHWQLLMVLKHLLFRQPQRDAMHANFDALYNQRFYEYDQRGPGYRRIYLIATTGQLAPSLQALVERSLRPTPTNPASDLLSIVLPVLTSTAYDTVLFQHNLTTRLDGFEQQQQTQTQLLQQTLERHATTIEVVRDLERRLLDASVLAAQLEAEKRGVQAQLDYVHWQHSLLQQALNRSLAQRIATGLRQLLRRFR